MVTLGAHTHTSKTTFVLQPLTTAVCSVNGSLTTHQKPQRASAAAAYSSESVCTLLGHFG